MTYIQDVFKCLSRLDIIVISRLPEDVTSDDVNVSTVSEGGVCIEELVVSTSHPQGVGSQHVSSQFVSRDHQNNYCRVHHENMTI